MEGEGQASSIKKTSSGTMIFDDLSSITVVVPMDYVYSSYHRVPATSITVPQPRFDPTGGLGSSGWKCATALALTMGKAKKFSVVG
jgi:hypothetical protein